MADRPERGWWERYREGRRARRERRAWRRERRKGSVDPGSAAAQSSWRGTHLPGDGGAGPGGGAGGGSGS